MELYPVESGDEVGLPGVKKLSSVDVKWGRLVFFEVQPGRSYHSVEEVVVGDGRQRLGVSGWYVLSCRDELTKGSTGRLRARLATNPFRTRSATKL